MQGLGRRTLWEVRQFAEMNTPKDAPGKPVVSPLIHLNGTSKSSLLEDYDQAREMVRSAIEQVQEIEFNARDYYPQGMEVWDQACAEMKDRLLSLQQVADELLAIMEAIDKQ